MILKSARITSFRSIEDSGEFSIDRPFVTEQQPLTYLCHVANSAGCYIRKLAPQPHLCSIVRDVSEVHDRERPCATMPDEGDRARPWRGSGP